MNRIRLFPLTLTVLAAAAMVAAVPARLQAQTGFQIGAQTGLEMDHPAASAPGATDKKSKPAADAEKKVTEITCSGETLFDVKAGKATFTQEVKIVDPQFKLDSEKLTVFLKKSAKTEPKPDGSPAASPAASPSATPNSDKNDPLAGGGTSGLDRAIAEGNVIITQDKVDEKTGEITHYVGKGQKADYNALSGEMTLTGWPQIQQGMNNQVATEEGTIMIMNKDGHLHTMGRSKTVIQAESKPAKPETAKPSPSQIP